MIGYERENTVQNLGEYLCVHHVTLRLPSGRFEKLRRIFLSPFEDRHMVLLSEDEMEACDVVEQSVEVLGSFNAMQEGVYEHEKEV